MLSCAPSSERAAREHRVEKHLAMPSLLDLRVPRIDSACILAGTDDAANGGRKTCRRKALRLARANRRVSVRDQPQAGRSRGPVASTTCSAEISPASHTTPVSRSFRSTSDTTRQCVSEAGTPVARPIDKSANRKKRIDHGVGFRPRGRDDRTRQQRFPGHAPGSDPEVPHSIRRYVPLLSSVWPPECPARPG